MLTSGLHHVILTISDPVRSRKFYADLFGFETKLLNAEQGGGFFFTVGGVMFFFYSSRHPVPGDRFNENRIGLDHLSFSVLNIEALQAVAQKLIAAGVDTKGVEQYAPTGDWYVAFRDPDNIQLEFWLP